MPINWQRILLEESKAGLPDEAREIPARSCISMKKPTFALDLSRASVGVVGMTGFEPATTRPPAEYATRLRHIPNIAEAMQIPKNNPACRQAGDKFQSVPVQSSPGTMSTESRLCVRRWARRSLSFKAAQVLCPPNRAYA